MGCSTVNDVGYYSIIIDLMVTFPYQQHAMIICLI